MLEDNHVLMEKICYLAADIHGSQSKDKKRNIALGYILLYEKLLSIEPITSDFSIYLHEEKDWFSGKKYFSISGFKSRTEEYNPKDPNTTFSLLAIEFTPWNEWLGSNVISKYGDIKTIAECLWEMTFIGFEEDEIREEKEKLNRRVEEIENGTAKLIPMEEVFKNIKEKNGKTKN